MCYLSSLKVKSSTKEIKRGKVLIFRALENPR